MRPSLIVHCDWSMHGSKRWCAKATRIEEDSYQACAPEPVGRLETFFPRLLEQAPTGPILVGFDFPIGIPRAYAERAGIINFPSMLSRFGNAEWRDFYDRAERPAKISLRRPFYPKQQHNVKKQDLVDGLGLSSAEELLRACERATQARGKACEIFWTLGGNQVGCAATTGWRDLLAPAMCIREISIWPFDGELSELLDSRRLIIAETYPGEIYSHLGIPRNFGKTEQPRRMVQANAVFSWCENNDVLLDHGLRWDIRDGFGNLGTGEDRFDAVVGLLGMIEAVREPSLFPVPKDSAVRNVEGWILGMKASPQPAYRHVRDSSTGTSSHHPESYSTKAKNVSSPPTGHEQLCPACKQKLFTRWPFGWDAHAAHRCAGLPMGSPEERKRIFRERYL